MLYAVGVKVPDPFVWFEFRNKTYAVVSRLEFDRVKCGATVDEVLASETLFSNRNRRKGTDVLISNLARKYGFGTVEVPGEFPLGLAESLRRRGLVVYVRKGAYFPDRQIKSTNEVEKIHHALRLAEMGLARGIEILKKSDIGRKRELIWAGRPLTSERLRGEIDATIIREGGLPAGTIVAGGNQACDPHERGFGPLRAHEAIILDIFPRDQKTGYFGDLTRTVVKGQASEALHRLYQTVKEGQSWVIHRIKVGVDGAKLHDQLTKRFTDAGYPTERREGRWVGFFHGTGHSLGLEIHESPRFSTDKFRAGTVMTVEPGLYFYGLGGVRLEDLVLIQSKGVRNLTTASFEFQI